MNSQNNSYGYKVAKKRVEQLRGFYIHALVYIFINAMIIIVSTWNEGLLPGLKDWGNYTTLLIWGIFLAFHAASVFLPNIFFGSNWEEKKIQEILKKEKQDNWK